LKLKSDEPLLSVTFNLNVRRYTLEHDPPPPAAAAAAAAGGKA
jgi:hypothetical protein